LIKPKLDKENMIKRIIINEKNYIFSFKRTRDETTNTRGTMKRVKVSMETFPTKIEIGFGKAGKKSSMHRCKHIKLVRVALRLY